MLSFLSLVHSFLRLRAFLKRHNSVMSKLYGLNRESDQIKQKKLFRTVIEMLACFIVGFIPLFVVNILQHQGKLYSMDPIVVARAIFAMTYATNVLVYRRNLRFFSNILFCSLSLSKTGVHFEGPVEGTNCEMACHCQNRLQVEKKNGTAWTQENMC